MLLHQQPSILGIGLVLQSIKMAAWQSLRLPKGLWASKKRPVPNLEVNTIPQ